MQKNDVGRSLLYRWFVEYNPLYLVSAALVLGGMVLTARGFAERGSLVGPLVGATIAEAYAGALIGAAALLTRVGQRRPAVLLALVTVLYQSDLMLHTETCPYLGVAGAITAGAWLAAFVAKLYALAWALRVRVSRRAAATACLGALGLVVGPYALAVEGVTARAAGLGVGAFVLALGALVPPTDDEAVTSLAPLDAWGRTVLRRTVRAVWIVWSVLFALHVLFWSTQHPVDGVPAFAALVLLAAHRAGAERRFWIASLALLGACAAIAPASFAALAVLVAAALVRRAFARVPLEAASSGAPAAAAAATTTMPSPYRVGVGATNVPAAARSHAPAIALVRADVDARERLLSGAVAATYLAAWTASWTAGPFPAHSLALDLAFAAAVAVLVLLLRARSVLVPFAIGVIHAVVASRLVPAPRSLLEWGALTVSSGFVLLLACVAVSYRLRRDPVG